MANYLYNGVELPELPSWDNKAYPYAVITQSKYGDKDYYLKIGKGRFEIDLVGSTEWFRGKPNTQYIQYKLSSPYTSWEYAKTDTFPSNGSIGDIVYTPFVWANHDIYYHKSYDYVGGTSDTIVLKASDPVPVPEEPEPEQPTTRTEWQKQDAYKPNTEWNGKTFYRVMGGKWVKQDVVVPQVVEVEPDVPEPDVPDVDPLPPAGSPLENYTWAEISAISAAGKAEEYFSVGDTKSVYLKGTVGTLELDTTLYVYILGFDHNKDITGDTGITFGTFKTADGNDVALCDSKYGKYFSNGTKYFNMNHWGSSNYGGWAASDLRYDILGSTDVAPYGYGAAKSANSVGYDASATCATNPVADTLMAALPADLRAVMKPMTTYADSKGNASNVEANVTASVDYLPLLAEFEVFGSRTQANEYEKNKQAQYKYFANGNSPSKNNHLSGSYVYWWERSARYATSTTFCTVSGSRADYEGAYEVYGIAPIFLV